FRWRHRRAGRLLAVAQRGVEHEYSRHASGLLGLGVRKSRGPSRLLSERARGVSSCDPTLLHHHPRRSGARTTSPPLPGVITPRSRSRRLRSSVRIRSTGIALSVFRLERGRNVYSGVSAPVKGGAGRGARKTTEARRPRCGAPHEDRWTPDPTPPSPP